MIAQHKNKYIQSVCICTTTPKKKKDRSMWRRLAVGLVGMLRVFYGQDPSVGVADTRSVRSTPTAGARGIDGGKKVNGIKLSIVTERWGFPLAMRVTTADVNDRDSLRDMLVELRAEWPSVDKLLADLWIFRPKVK